MILSITIYDNDGTITNKYSLVNRQLIACLAQKLGDYYFVIGVQNTLYHIHNTSFYLKLENGPNKIECLSPASLSSLV